METNKIIVWTSPTAPFQKIYVIKDGTLVDQMGVKPDDIRDIVYALADKYNIVEIDFSGSTSYGAKILEDAENGQVIRYGKAKLKFSFVK